MDERWVRVGGGSYWDQGDTVEMETSSYALRVKTTKSFEKALTAVREALSEQGFGILTEIDVRSVLKEKLGGGFRRYMILGPCNPEMARRALAAELEVGLLLPCNVIVYEEDDGAVVAALNPEKALELTGNPDLASPAEEARARLEEALKSLA